MPDRSVFQRLAEKKLVQWGLAYLAAAWMVFEVTDVVGGRWQLPDAFLRGLSVVLFVGFFVALVVAWYHGEKGRQTVSGPELLMVTALLVIAGGVLAMLKGPDEPEDPASTPTSPARSGDERPSVAVLPLQNLSPNSEDAYFADGMQEEITAKLSALSGLRVVSRSSVMQYRDARPPSPQIAEELGVGFVVEGSARLLQDKVRLTVQLIDANKDAHLWAEDYDVDLTARDLFEVESEVARKIAFEIGVNLTPAEREEIGRVLTGNTDAYLLYLQGNEAFAAERVWGRLAAQYESVRLLERSLELDPDFALARALLALSLSYSTEPESVERSKREAETALRLLPGVAEARVALGRHAAFVGEFEDAKRHYLAAQAEAPNLALGVLELGLLQQGLGEFDVGIRTLRNAEILDPRNPLVQSSLTRALIFQHQYQEALEANRIRQSVLPSYAGIRDQIWIHLLRGDSANARAAAEELLDTDAWGFYNFVIANPYEVVRSVLTREELDRAFDSYHVAAGEPQQPCSDIPEHCLRRAIHEGEVGSGNVADALFDSLRVVAEATPVGESTQLTALIFMGMAEKERAIRAAEAYVSRIGQGPGGQFYNLPRARILLARVLAHFGEADRAVDLLEELLPAPSWLSVPVLKVDRIWDPLRDHPRFQALLQAR